MKFTPVPENVNVARAPVSIASVAVPPLNVLLLFLNQLPV
jgi:hypothetical protein